tara:strand:- start:3857 stop:4921 length:1065 start_codon:yes stop_codon:yes gene_type:complete
MSDKEIISRSIREGVDYTDSLLSEKKTRHIAQGGLNKGGAFLEIYHLASKQSAIFKAFLTSINDSFNVSFRAETAFGRSDPYRLYEGNERVIGVSFDVPAFDVVEAMNNLAKISLVTSMLYPTYEETGQGINALQIKSPPIIRIKFANLITNTANPRGGAKTAGLAVAISNFSVTPDVEQGFFISNDRSGKGEMLYPKLFQLSLDMAVIHEHPLGFSHTSGYDLGPTKSQGMRNFPYAVPKAEIKDTDFLQGKTPRSTATNAVKKQSAAGKNKASGEELAAEGFFQGIEDAGDDALSQVEIATILQEQQTEANRVEAKAATQTKPASDDTSAFPRTGDQKIEERAALIASNLAK